MAQGFNQIVNALEVRFDFHSARTLAREALGSVGLEEKTSYTEGELGRFADGLNAVATKLTKVWAKLGVAPSGVEVPPPAPVVAAEPEPEPAAAEEDSGDE